MTRIVWRNLALLVVAATIILANLYLITRLPSTADWSFANQQWNGLSVWHRQYSVASIGSSGIPALRKNSVLVVIARRPPTPADLAGLRAYVQGGGALWLLDDFGYGNAYAAGLDIPIRFSGLLLRDPVFFAGAPILPKVTWIDAAGRTGTLVLDRATVLTNTGGSLVIAATSRLAYLQPATGKPADAETAPFPVIATIPSGGGAVTAISDASLLVNGVLALGDNARLVSALVGSRQFSVYTDSLPPDRLAAMRGWLGGSRAVFANPLVLASLLILLAFVILPPREQKAVRKRSSPLRE